MRQWGEERIITNSPHGDHTRDIVPFPPVLLAGIVKAARATAMCARVGPSPVCRGSDSTALGAAEI